MFYEIQVFRDQAWRVDSVFDDKDLAVYEARRLNAGGRYLAVRVMEDFFDLKTGLSRLRPVFRASKVESVEARAAAADEERIERLMRRPRPSVARRRGIGVMALVFRAFLTCAFLAAGIGALYWLEPLLGRGLP